MKNLHEIPKILSRFIKTCIALAGMLSLGNPSYSNGGPGRTANIPPVVTMVNPAFGITYNNPSTVGFEASAVDPDGTIAKVDFYANSVLIGSSSASPYVMTWSNIPLGSYDIIAVATDDGGLTASSSAVSVTIQGPPYTFLFSFIKISGDNMLGQNLIGWSTTNCSNTDHFDVQRSVDGINFYSISSTPYQALSGDTLNYIYSDLGAAIGDSYYRIKRVSSMNDSAFSLTILVTNTGSVNSWNGNNSADWNNGGNWSQGTAPSGGNMSVIISAPSNNNFQPVIPAGANIKVKDITIAPGAAITINGILQVEGKMINKGTVTCKAGKIMFKTAGHLTKLVNVFSTAVDWRKIYALGNNSTSFENYYTYWDANLGSHGGYVTVNPANVSVPLVNGNTLIPAGAAFFVTPKNNRISSFTMQEQGKNSNYTINTVLPVDQQPRLDVLLYFYNSNGIRRVADGVASLFDDTYCGCVDGNDAVQIQNIDEDIAFKRNSQLLSIETRPTIVASDTLFIYMNRMNVQGYEWQLNPTNWPVGYSFGSVTAELVDTYTGIRTPVSLTTNTVLAFTVTSAPGSGATDRFYIVFTPAGPLPLTLLGMKAYPKDLGINVDWGVSQQSNMSKYEIERSITGNSFAKVGTVAATANQSENYTWFDANPNMGVNYYRLKMIDANGRHSYSHVVKVTLNSTSVPAIGVYPNPVSGSTVMLQLNNLDKGTYNISMINKLGQTVYSKQINHEGGSVTQALELDNRVASGVYYLRVAGASGSYSVQVFKQ